MMALTASPTSVADLALVTQRASGTSRPSGTVMATFDATMNGSMVTTATLKHLAMLDGADGADRPGETTVETMTTNAGQRVMR